ncbi:MAG: DUF4376 domain-containing protein [Desulfuromonadaceae bacterium]
MARFAIIDAGRVINHAEADADFAASQGWFPAGDSHIGDFWDGSVFSSPTVDITALKLAKNADINAARLAANFSTFPHAGKAIACDQLSRSDIDGTNGFVSLYGTLPPGWPGGWKAVDNTYVPISSVDGWKAFYSSMFAAGNANFAKAQALKTQLEAATTAAEVQAIVW